MNRAYRVKVKVTEAALLGETRLEGVVLILLWSAATAVGVGTGWYIALATGGWFLGGVPLGICQGLVLLPRWNRTLGWAMATSLGWVIGFALMAGLGALVKGFVPADWWVTEHEDNIGWAIALLPFVGIPAIAEAQWIVMRRWVAKEPWIFWFGVSVCSFPVAGFIGLVLFDPGQSSGTLFSPSAIQPVSRGLSDTLVKVLPCDQLTYTFLSNLR